MQALAGGATAAPPGGCLVRCFVADNPGVARNPFDGPVDRALPQEGNLVTIYINIFKQPMRPPNAMRINSTEVVY